MGARRNHLQILLLGKVPPLGTKEGRLCSALHYQQASILHMEIIEDISKPPIRPIRTAMDGWKDGRGSFNLKPDSMPASVVSDPLVDGPPGAWFVWAGS